MLIFQKAALKLHLEFLLCINCGLGPNSLYNLLAIQFSILYMEKMQLNGANKIF